MASLCQSIKSKREPTVRCNRVCGRSNDGGKVFCGTHERQKTQTIWKEQLTPMSCSNQHDPITLESLWEERDGERVAGTIGADLIFYYTDNTFQRGLDINSMALLIRYPTPMDPFTNLPMEQSVIDRAKEMIANMGSRIKIDKLSKKDKLRKKMDEIVDCFYTLGYTIQRTHLENKTKQEYLKWLWEIMYIAKSNNIEIPLSVAEINSIVRTAGRFDEKILDKLKTVASFSPMATIICLTALCYIDPILRAQYPNIFD